MTKIKFLLSILFFVSFFTFVRANKPLFSNIEIESLIALGQQKLRTAIIQNKAIIEKKQKGELNFVISLFPTQEDLVKDQAIGNYGSYLSSGSKEANINSRLNKVYADAGLECYIILINAFDAKIKAAVPENFSVKDLFGNSTFIQEQSNIAQLTAQHNDIAKRIIASCAAYTQQRNAIVITTGAYHVAYTDAKFGEYNLYHIKKIVVQSTPDPSRDEIFSYIKSSIAGDSQFKSTLDKDSIASMEVSHLERAVKNVAKRAQIMVCTTSVQLGNLLSDFKATDYFPLEVKHRLHILNILSQGSMSGYWLSNSSDEEGMAIRVLRYVPEEQNSELALGLEQDKQNTGTGKIIYRLVSKTNDGLLEKNYTKLSLVINDLLMKSNLAESKMQEITEDNICERIFFYNKVSSAEPALGSMTYEFTLGTDASITVKSKRVVSYTDHITVVAGGDPIIQTTAVYQDVPSFQLKPFDLVCISNDNGLSFLEGDAAINERVIVPAIYLTYIAQKQFNETVIKDVAIAADVLTLATGVGAISAGIKAGRLAFTLFEMSNALANIGTNVAGEDLSPAYKQVLDYSNGLMMVLGGSKVLSGGITTTKVGYEQARNATKISKQQLEEFAQKTSTFITEYSSNATLASKKGAKYLYRQYTFIEKECKKVLGKTLAQVRNVLNDMSNPFKPGYTKESILAIPKGSRPNPNTYLKADYITDHSSKFEGGASYLVPKSVLDNYGRTIIGRPDGQFVMTKLEMDDLLAKANGDLAIVEAELGIPAGVWKNKDIVRIDIPNPKELNARIPSGNEGGANELWLPGGKLPQGYLENIIDQIPQGKYIETLTQIK